jgi:ABC-type uncharacterized transport system substrate-binding protein
MRRRQFIAGLGAAAKPVVVEAHGRAEPHRETKTIPIVFAVVNDPVGEGFVETLSRLAWPQVHVAFR